MMRSGLGKEPSSCSSPPVIRILPLPGSPRWGGEARAVLERARADAEALAEGGCDALLVLVRPPRVAGQPPGTPEIFHLVYLGMGRVVV